MPHGAGDHPGRCRRVGSSAWHPHDQAGELLVGERVGGGGLVERSAGEGEDGSECGALGRHQEESGDGGGGLHRRSEEHTSELQSLMRISYAVFCLKKNKSTITN